MLSETADIILNTRFTSFIPLFYNSRQISLLNVCLAWSFCKNIQKLINRQTIKGDLFIKNK